MLACSGHPARPSGAGPLQQPWQFGEYAGRVAARGRRLAGGQADFPQCEAEAGDAVHQQQHRFSLVAEMFGHGHGGERRLPAQQRRRIGGGDDDHRAGQPGLAQIVLDELPHLASALPDQGEHGDIAGGMPRQHGEQRRLADAGAGEQAEPLPLPAGRKAVQGAHAEIQPGAEPRPQRRIGRCRAHLPGTPAGRQGPAPVQRPAQRVEHAPQPTIRNRQRPSVGAAIGLDLEHSCGTRPEPIEPAEWHRLRQAMAEGDDFRRHGLTVLAGEQQPVTDRGVSRKPVDVDDQTGQSGDAALQAKPREIVQTGTAYGCVVEKSGASH